MLEPNIDIQDIITTADRLEGSKGDLLNIIEENNTMCINRINESMELTKKYTDETANKLKEDYFYFTNLIFKNRQNKLNWFQRILWKILGLWCDFDE